MVELSPRGDVYVLGFAGDTFNTVWYARRMAPPETEVAFVSAVGDDDISRRMKAFIEGGKRDNTQDQDQTRAHGSMAFE